MCDLGHTYWIAREKWDKFYSFQPQIDRALPPLPRQKIEQPALIYLSQLLGTAKDAKKLGDLQVKAYAKISLCELYEITGPISETKQLISRGLTKWARKNLTILK